MPFPQGWVVSPDAKRVGIQVETQDFLDALDLFEEIADIAEELGHHPDLHLESYNQVRIETYSHDVGKLTERDERLATRIHVILRRRRIAR